MVQLVIAEKPSVARDLANLSAQLRSRRKEYRYLPMLQSSFHSHK
jgi:hypothetical protein